MCFFILCAWEILAKNSHLNSLGLLNEKMIYTRLLFVVNQNIKLKKICPIHTKAKCSHSLWLWFTASKIMPFFSGCVILMIVSALVYLIDENLYPNAIKFVDPVLALTSIIIVILTSVNLFKELSLILLQGRKCEIL